MLGSSAAGEHTQQYKFTHPTIALMPKQSEGDAVHSETDAGEAEGGRDKARELLLPSGAGEPQSRSWVNKHTRIYPESYARGLSYLQEQLETDTAMRDRMMTFEFLQSLAFTRNTEEIEAQYGLDMMAEPLVQLIVAPAVKVIIAATKEAVRQAVIAKFKSDVPIAADLVEGILDAIMPAVPSFLEMEEHDASFRRAIRRALDGSPETPPAPPAPRAVSGHDALEGQGEGAPAKGTDAVLVEEKAVHKQKLKHRAAPVQQPSAFTDTGLHDMSQEVSTGTGLQILHAVSLAAGDNLRHALNRSVTRQAARALITSLTVSLTSTMTHLTGDHLHKSLTILPTHTITRPLIPMLTHSVAASVSQAMTRKPQFDYFCHYCLSSSHLYCKYCWESIELGQPLDHYVNYSYVNYFAAYYSKYYDSFYGDEYADRIATDVLERGPRFKNSDVDAQVNKYKEQTPQPQV